MQKYNKAFSGGGGGLAFAVILAMIAREFGVELTAAEVSAIGVVIGGLMGFIVWAVPNQYSSDEQLENLIKELIPQARAEDITPEVLETIGGAIRRAFNLRELNAE